MIKKLKTKVSSGFVAIAIFSVVSLSSCYPSVYKNEEAIVLPKILHEISGLTDFGPTTIACVQDEKGIVFIYDFVKQEIIQEIQFAEDGDYEGISRVGNFIYILRSDGVIFKVSLNNNIKTEQYKTGILAKDNEALCYDKDNERLLIGCKVKNGKEANKNQRHIYSFDLKSKAMNSIPAYSLNKEAIIAFADKHKIMIPIKKKNKSENLELNLKLGISGISIHPKTKDLYILSSVDHLLLIYSNKGELIDLQILDKQKHLQPEGITFFDNGDLFISNEGKNNGPLLYRYSN